MNKEDVLRIIDNEEENYTWGGSENEDGALSRGNIDFDRIRNAVKELKVKE